MFKSVKQHPAAKLWGKLTTRRMNRDLKNLKITPPTHLKLKVFAAENGVPISECADRLLLLCLDTPSLSKKVHAAIDEIRMGLSSPDD